MAGPQERFGDQIRHYREAAGYSQEELAERAGMSVNAIGAIERGERKRPYPDTIRRLAAALNLDETARLALTATLRGEPTPPETPAPALAPDLPGEPTPFLGRDRELATLQPLLTGAEGRLLTLIGPGGVGKTRLALHLARLAADEFPDGVSWVDLAPLADPALVLPTIGRAIGLDDAAQGDPGPAIRDRLRDRQALLVLDNVEHLRSVVPEIAQLLASCSRLRILATSRSPLRIRGEQEFPVPPLDVPGGSLADDLDALAAIPSVRFFLWQARQKRPDFSLTAGNAAAVAAICRRLDGLPLAIELVAARMRMLGPDEVLAHLDRQMPLLVGGARDLPQRQQTMRAAIAWGYDLLSPAEQRLFRRLSVFAGGWTLDAAVAIGGDGQGDVVDLLDALVEQSMVTVVRDTSGTRFGMLEPIRQFAREALDDAGEDADARRHHAHHFLQLAEAAAKDLEGRSGQAAVLGRLERDHDNIRAALTWSEQTPGGHETGLRIAASLWRFWEMRWYVDEGSRWLDGALAHSDDSAPEIRARALSAAGNLARDRGDLDAATGFHQRSLAIRRSLGDARGIAISLNNLGVIARDRGDADETIRCCQESLALFRHLGDRHLAAIALISLAMAEGQRGNDEQARLFYQESLALFRASGDDWHTGWVLLYLAELQVAHGDHAAARAHAAEGRDLHRTAGDAWGMAMAFTILGRADQADGNLDDAIRHLAEALRLLVGARVERALPTCLDDLAGALLARGEPAIAARLAGASEALRAGGRHVSAQASPATATLAPLRNGPHASEWSAGFTRGRDQAIADALAAADRFTGPEIAAS